MATSPDYKDYVLELLESIYPVTARSMFGGVGIYAADLMCALISSEDVLYFKVDNETKADYIAADMPQFMRMPYFEVPVEVLEKPELLSLWFKKTIAAAKRLGRPKKSHLKS